MAALDEAGELRLMLVRDLIGQDRRNTDILIEDARRLADFILGTNDAEVLRAARDLADKVKG